MQGRHYKHKDAHHCVCVYAQTTNATHNVAIKNTLHTNSYKLIQSCDWFTALLAFAVKSVKCKLHHTNRSPKHASCPPCPTHLPLGWNCKSWRWNDKATFLDLGRSNCEWLLVHNFALMQLQNLHHIRINTITFSLMQFHIDDSCASLSSVWCLQTVTSLSHLQSVHGMITAVI